MAKLVNDSLYSNPLRQGDFFDHFFALDVTSTWTDTSADTGAAPSLGVAGESTVSLTTGAADNQDCILSTKTKWDVLASRPLVAECRMQYAEAATSAANLFFGFSSIGATADLLRDDGAGISTTSASGIWIYKVDGGTKWKCGCQVATVSYGDSTSTTTAGGSSFQSLRIEVRPISTTEAEVVYLCDPNGGSDFHHLIDGTSFKPIKHLLTYTSYAAAFLALSVKSGSSSAETAVWDLVRVSQVL